MLDELVVLAVFPYVYFNTGKNKNYIHFLANHSQNYLTWLLKEF
jgi:hypothetical protein